MKKKWNDIKWIFINDGSLRDIYIQDATVEDWKKLIDFMNENCSLQYKYYESQKTENKIDKEYVINYLINRSNALEGCFVSIDLAGIFVNCYFFLPTEIEFDITPHEIKTLEDYEIIEDFMLSISRILSKQVTLTFENDITLPIIKIDTTKNVNIILSNDEYKKYCIDSSNTLRERFQQLKTNLILKYFPSQMKKRLLQSAMKIHEPTSKDKNIW